MGKEENKELVKAQGKDWKGKGKEIAKTEIWLKAEGLEIETKAKALTVTKGNIAIVETFLADSSRTLKILGEKRLEITRPLEDLKKRLMVPEKAVVDSLNALKASLLTVKKQAQKEQNEAAIKVDQEAALKLAIANTYTDYFTDTTKAVDKYIGDNYSGMLRKKILYIDFDKTVKIIVDHFKEPSYAAYFAKIAVNTSSLTLERITEIQTANAQTIPDYKGLIQERFDDKKVSYQVEIANAEEAIKQQAKETEEREKQAEYAKRQQELSNKMDSKADAQATQEAVVVEGKNLKTSYVLDMEETAENVLRIFACYGANFEEVNTHLKIKKWFACTPNQIGTALAKIKTKDNNFQFEGINFKEETKL